MTATPAAGTDRSRLLLAIGAAAFSVVGVAVVAAAALVVIVLVTARLAGSGGIGAVSAGISTSILTIWMVLSIGAAGFVALRVFRMVRAGDRSPAPPN